MRATEGEGGTRGGATASPFFRENDAAHMAAQPSPLFSQGRSERYKLKCDKSTASTLGTRSGKPGGRALILPTAFSSFEKNSTDRKATTSNAIVTERTPLLGHTPTSAASCASPSHHEVKQVIPKNSVLAILETSTSAFIFYLLLSPLMAAAGVHWMLSQWKYADWSPRILDGNEFVFNSIPLSASFICTTFILAGDDLAAGGDFDVAVNITTAMSADSFDVSFALADWVSLFSADGKSFNSSNVLTLPLPFVDISALQFADTAGTVSASFAVSLTDNVKPESLIMRFTTLSDTYVVCTAAVKVLWLLALLVLLVWFVQRVWTHARHVQARVQNELTGISEEVFSIWYFILPEQFACMAALLLLCMWLNPIGLAQDLFPYSSLPSSMRLAGHQVGILGGYGLLCVMVCYMHGLRWSSNSVDEKRTLAQLADLENAAQAESPPIGMRRKWDRAHVSSLVRSVYSSFVPSHHPMASGFLDFVLPNAALCVLSCVVVCSRLLLILMWEPTPSKAHSLETWLWTNADAVLVLLDVAVLLLAAVWVSVVLQTYWQTQIQLRETRYMQSRLRQVSFRLLTWELGLALALLAALWGDALVANAPRLPRWPELAPLLLYFYSMLRHVGLLYVVAGRPTAQALSIEAATFLAVLVANTTYTFSPGTEGPSDSDIETFIPLRRQMRPVQGVWPRALLRGPRPAHPPRDPFCLETACYLLEASYQAYFPIDPQKAYHMHSDSYAVLNADSEKAQVSGEGKEPDAFTTGPRLDLSRLGLQSCGVFSCSAFCTFGYFGRSDSEFVVAFRGSTMANIAADFKFSQVPLPDLRRPTSFFLEAFSFMECTGNPFRSIEVFDRSHSASADAAAWEAEDATEAGGRLLAATRWLVAQLPLCRQTLPRVHQGFWESYASIRDEFMAKMAQALFTEHFQGAASHSSRCAPPILFTGHSLGAAMATLASLELAVNLPVISAAITAFTGRETEPPARALSVCVFGSPRVGNAAFSARVHHEVDSCYRVQVDGDIVTMVPKLLGSYRHVGHAVLVDELGSGNLAVQPSALETALFRRTTGTLANHSLEKYRLCLEACFEPADYAEYLAGEQGLLTGASQ